MYWIELTTLLGVTIAVVAGALQGGDPRGASWVRFAGWFLVISASVAAAAAVLLRFGASWGHHHLTLGTIAGLLAIASLATLAARAGSRRRGPMSPAGDAQSSPARRTGERRA